jgi:ubiquitin-protein ligase
MSKTLADKRLLFEICRYNKEKRTFGDVIEIDVSGIYLLVNQSNIRSQKALILGPKDTPYENGYYAFDISIPDDYPFNPPKVKHLTTDGAIRFNPNLYTCGKVCLSILGTWSGPAWCSTMNIETVLQYLRMIMNEDPLRNEPGYSDPKQHSVPAKIYSQYVRYHNYNYAIQSIRTKNNYPMFKEIIEGLYAKTYERNIEKLKELAEKNPTETLIYPNYCVGTTEAKWAEVLQKFEKNKPISEPIGVLESKDVASLADELQTKL